MEEGYEELAFSAYISFYFEKGTGYGHSYNGRRLVCDLSNYYY